MGRVGTQPVVGSDERKDIARGFFLVLVSVGSRALAGAQLELRRKMKLISISQFHRNLFDGILHQYATTQKSINAKAASLNCAIRQLFGKTFQLDSDERAFENSKETKTTKKP